jgi:hypothetical protein
VRKNGRIIVPGVVPLATTRGARVLMLERGADGERTGYVLPLPSSPGAAERAWSEWLPRAAAGAAPLPDGVRYRVRVLAQSEPVRTDTVGAFAIDLIAEYSNGGASRALYTNARYHITHGGALVTLPDSGDITAAWVVNAPSPALLVQTRGPSSDWRCALLSDEAGTLRTQTLGRCERPMRAAPLDGASSHVARTARLDDGTMDRTTFAVPGVYLLAEAVLDTRTLAVTAMDRETASALTPWFAPIGMSPDGQRFVRATSDNDTMQLMEIALPTFEMRALPLAHVVLPTGDWDDADGAWFAHHFEWRANAAGVQQAQPRANVTPLVRRGVLKREPTGDSYDVRRVQRALRTEVLMHLVQTLGAELVTDDGNPADDRAAPRSDDGVPFSRRLRLRNAEVQVSWISDGERLSVWVYPGVDTTLVPMIAERLDAQLATRAWDAFFVPAGAP